jgi:y4mF family transcriptional regulator
MKISRSEDIGALVRDRRRVLKLTQTQLATMLGVSQKYISHLERGKSTLHLGLVLRALRTLGVDLTVDVPSENRRTSQTDNVHRRRRPRIDIDRLVDG